MIVLNDIVKLVITSAPNGYGDVTVDSLVDLKCSFAESNGLINSSHVDIINSDAYAYIDFTNSVVLDKAFRIEGMHIIANLFNGIEVESWYRITKVVVSRTKLTCNEIDNVKIYLKKTESL